MRVKRSYWRDQILLFLRDGNPRGDRKKKKKVAVLRDKKTSKQNHVKTRDKKMVIEDKGTVYFLFYLSGLFNVFST